MHASLIFALFAAIAITGCATTGANIYLEPIDEGHATLNTSIMLRESLFEWKRITVLAIGNKFLDVSLWDGLPMEKLKVKAGTHQLSVAVTLHHGLGAGFLGTTLTVPVELASGTEYRLAGKNVGIKMEVWLTDHSGNRASAITSGDLGQIPQAAPAFIFLPTK